MRIYLYSNRSFHHPKRVISWVNPIHQPLTQQFYSFYLHSSTHSPLQFPNHTQKKKKNTFPAPRQLGGLILCHRPRMYEHTPFTSFCDTAAPIRSSCCNGRRINRGVCFNCSISGLERIGCAMLMDRALRKALKRTTQAWLRVNIFGGLQQKKITCEAE